MAEIRPILLEELEEYVRLDAYAFGYKPTAEVMARYRASLRPEETLAIFEDGRMVAHLVAYGWRMAINGGTVPLGGVADVAVWPEARRAGHAATLLSACLRVMRDRGLCLSMLHPSFYALYYRFGWALAAESRTYTFRPADLRFCIPFQPDGRFERLSAEERAVIVPLYERWLASRNGALVRGEAEWTALLFRVPVEAGPSQLVVWRDKGGEAQGYLIHHYPVRTGDFTPTLYDQEIRVVDFVAHTPAAYRALVEYLARHDLAERVRLTVPPDDPFLSLLTDPRAVKVETRPDIMLRIVDLVPALEARPYLPGPPTRLILRVTDTAAPWNEGTWALEVAGGKAHVTPSAARPDITTDIATLAALYNGYLAPGPAMRSRLLEAETKSALDAAAQVFATSAPPFCPDYF